MELSAWADKRVDALSKGMSQKAQFIAAVIAEPQLLILDEPFSGLDPVNMEMLKDIVLELEARTARPCCFRRTTWTWPSVCATPSS